MKKDTYVFQIKKIRLEDSEEEIDCWIYLLFRYKPHMMDLPFFKAYLSKADHDKEYVPVYLRQDGGPEYWTDVKMIDFPAS